MRIPNLYNSIFYYKSSYYFLCFARFILPFHSIQDNPSSVHGSPRDCLCIPNILPVFITLFAFLSPSMCSSSIIGHESDALFNASKVVVFSQRTLTQEEGVPILGYSLLKNFGINTYKDFTISYSHLIVFCVKKWCVAKEGNYKVIAEHVVVLIHSLFS